MSFFLLGAEQRLQNNHLMAINKIIDWQRIEPLFKGLYKRDLLNQGGQKPYRALSMCKAVLLGQWHQLSDQELVNALSVRIDFMVFTGFSLEDKLPDESTFCRFRNRLKQANLEQKIFDEINQQLSEQGFAIKEAQTAVVDATLIESSCRPKRCIEIVEDRNETEEASSEKPQEVIVEESADLDARWIKKGKKSHFGYKGFVSVEGQHGFIQTLHVTSANVSEVNQLEPLISPLSSLNALLADKGYASAKNREWLDSKEIEDGIMRKAARNRPLSDEDKAVNKIISHWRYIIEQCFGTLKRRFGFRRASYRGIAGVQSQLYWKAICFNLLKAKNLLCA